MPVNDFMKALEGDMNKRMQKAGIYLQSEIRKSLNRSQAYQRYTGTHEVYYRGLDPSKPGEYPKKLSSQLVKSITYTLKDLVLIVGSNLKGYPAFLQKGTVNMKPRPWLSLAWAAHKDKIAEILFK